MTKKQIKSNQPNKIQAPNPKEDVKAAMRWENWDEVLQIAKIMLGKS